MVAHRTLGPSREELRQERLPQHADPVGPLEPGHHVFDERVHRLGCEAAERMPGRAASDGLQGHPGRVGRYLDRLPSCGPAIPTGGQLVGDVEHDRVVTPHRLLAEGGHQHIVGLLPVRLVVVGGEQAVAAQDAQRLDVGADVLAEAGLVAEFGHRFRPSGDDVPRPQEPELEDRSELGQRHRRLRRSVRAESQHIAQHRYPSARVWQRRIGPAVVHSGHVASLRRCCTCVK